MNTHASAVTEPHNVDFLLTANGFAVYTSSTHLRETLSGLGCLDMFLKPSLGPVVGLQVLSFVPGINLDNSRCRALTSAPRSIIKSTETEDDKPSNLEFPHRYFNCML